MSQATDPNHDSYPITYKTEAHRFKECVNYERTVVREILKEGYVCHVGFAYDDFKNPPYPVALPTLYALEVNTYPEPDRLYLHSSSEARLYLYAAAINAENQEEGVPVCLTVSLVDSIVLQSAAAHNAVYYRSVMAYGKAIPVKEEDKMQALKVVVEHMVKGRWDDTDHPAENELKGVGVLCLELTEVSAKIQKGITATGKYGLKYEEDQSSDHWSGSIPVLQAYGALKPYSAIPPPVPEYLKNYHRPQT